MSYLEAKTTLEKSDRHLPRHHAEEGKSLILLTRTKSVESSVGDFYRDQSLRVDHPPRSDVAKSMLIQALAKDRGIL